MAAYYVDMTLRVREEGSDLTSLAEPLKCRVARLTRVTDATVGMNIATRAIFVTMHLEADTEYEAVMDSLASIRDAINESGSRVAGWDDSAEVDCLFFSLMRTVM